MILNMVIVFVMILIVVASYLCHGPYRGPGSFCHVRYGGHCGFGLVVILIVVLVTVLMALITVLVTGLMALITVLVVVLVIDLVAFVVYCGSYSPPCSLCGSCCLCHGSSQLSRRGHGPCPDRGSSHGPYRDSCPGPCCGLYYGPRLHFYFKILFSPI